MKIEIAKILGAKLSCVVENFVTEKIEESIEKIWNHFEWVQKELTDKDKSLINLYERVKTLEERSDELVDNPPDRDELSRMLDISLGDARKLQGEISDLKAEIENHKNVVRDLLKYKKAVNSIGAFFFRRILTEDQHQVIGDVFRIIKEETGEKYGD